MSTTLLMHKTLGGSLQPIDDQGRAVIAKLGRGEVVAMTMRRPRNVGHHRKLFALLSLIHENQSRYPTVEDLLDAIKIYIGHCTTITLRDGRTGYVPKSISFAQMDQAGFETFWDRIVTVVCEQIIPGLQRADLERELVDLVA